MYPNPRAERIANNDTSNVSNAVTPLVILKVAPARTGARRGPALVRLSDQSRYLHTESVLGI